MQFWSKTFPSEWPHIFGTSPIKSANVNKNSFQQFVKAWRKLNTNIIIYLYSKMKTVQGCSF